MNSSGIWRFYSSTFAIFGRAAFCAEKRIACLCLPSALADDVPISTPSLFLYQMTKRFIIGVIVASLLSRRRENQEAQPKRLGYTGRELS